MIRVEVMELAKGCCGRDCGGATCRGKTFRNYLMTARESHLGQQKSTVVRSQPLEPDYVGSNPTSATS